MSGMRLRSQRLGENSDSEGDFNQNEDNGNNNNDNDNETSLININENIGESGFVEIDDNNDYINSNSNNHQQQDNSNSYNNRNNQNYTYDGQNTSDNHQHHHTNVGNSTQNINTNVLFPDVEWSTLRTALTKLTSRGGKLTSDMNIMIDTFAENCSMPYLMKAELSLVLAKTTGITEEDIEAVKELTEIAIKEKRNLTLIKLLACKQNEMKLKLDLQKQNFNRSSTASLTSTLSTAGSTKEGGIKLPSTAKKWNSVNGEDPVVYLRGFEGQMSSANYVETNFGRLLYQASDVDTQEFLTGLNYLSLSWIEIKEKFIKKFACTYMIMSTVQKITQPPRCTTVQDYTKCINAMMRAGRQLKIDLFKPNVLIAERMLKAIPIKCRQEVERVMRSRDEDISTISVESLSTEVVISLQDIDKNLIFCHKCKKRAPTNHKCEQSKDDKSDNKNDNKGKKDRKCWTCNEDWVHGHVCKTKDQ